MQATHDPVEVSQNGFVENAALQPLFVVHAMHDPVPVLQSGAVGNAVRHSV